MTKKSKKKKQGGRKHTKKGGKINKLSKKDSLSRKEKKALRKKRHNISESSHKIQNAILCDCVGINPMTARKIMVSKTHWSGVVVQNISIHCK